MKSSTKMRFSSPSCIAVAVFASLIFLYTFNISPLFWLRTLFENEPTFYVVVFDAGSTGTRVHVFHFERSGKRMRLLNELFEHLEPGLSAYAEDPSLCRPSLEKLLNSAESEIPPSKRASTPLVLKATAGLRLLPGDRAERILRFVRTVFNERGFLFRDSDVSILDGVEEGNYGWVTVNFLLGRLIDFSKPKVATMDLGGGSTQVTFAVDSPAAVQSVPRNFLKSISVLGQQINFYSHSYLGMGLMAARLSILRNYSGDNKNVMNSLISPCLPSRHSDEWTYGGVTYRVKGNEKSGPSACSQNVNSVILGAELKKLPAYVHQNVKVFAFSYYFDRLLEVGTIGNEGGIVRVVDVGNAAHRTCRDFPAGKRPFLCMDLTFIYELLTTGFGFAGENTIELRKKIEGKEVSWSLGAAFSFI